MLAPLLVLLEPPNPIILSFRQTLHSHLKIMVQGGSAGGLCTVVLVAFGNQLVLVVDTLFVVVDI